MSEKGYVSEMINEIWTKVEKISFLSEDERANAFRIYKLLYNFRSYKIMPIFLSILLAGTISFFTSGFILSKLGSSDPRLIYSIVGSFFFYLAIIFAVLKLKFYGPLVKAEISGFKYAVDHDPHIKSVIEIVIAKDPAAAKNIKKYLSC